MIRGELNIKYYSKKEILALTETKLHSCVYLIEVLLCDSLRLYFCFWFYRSKNHDALIRVRVLKK